MRKVFALLTLVLLLAGPALAQSVDADHLIVPGVGIGKVKLGMTIDDVKAVLGNEDEVRNAGPYVLYLWWFSENGTLKAWVSNGKIVRAGIYHDHRFAVSEGLTTEVYETTVRKAMGNPSYVRAVTEPIKIRVMTYKGIDFLIADETRHGTVRDFTVDMDQGQVFEIDVFQSQ